jgi:hypothetical protein
MNKNAIVTCTINNNTAKVITLQEKYDKNLLTTS